MASSLNKVIIVGRLGKDPEVRSTQSGQKIANLSVATSETWKDKASGEKKEQTEWHRVVLFGKTAEVAESFVKKGSQICLEGKLQTREWADKDNTERYITEVLADSLVLLDSKPTATDTTKQESQQTTTKEAPFSDESPF